jgi:hypothetical protein
MFLIWPHQLDLLYHNQHTSKCELQHRETDRWCKPAFLATDKLKARRLMGSYIYRVPMHMSLCLDASCKHSVIKEAVLFLLQAHSWNHMWPELSLNERSSIELSHRVAVATGTLQCLNPCGAVNFTMLVYEQSVYEFLHRHFETTCRSQCLSWAGIGPRIFSNAQNTMTSHSSLCSSSSISVLIFLSALF